MNKDILLKELKFCLKIWKEKGGCNFGGKSFCKECATPYLLLKLISEETLHDPHMQRLNLKDWEDKLAQL